MKTRVRNIFAFASFLVAVTMTGCSKKIDEAYANPNAPTKVPIETILPGVEAGMLVFASANGTLYGVQRDLTYIGRFIQYWGANASGNRNDQMGDFFNTPTPDLMGDIWAMFYYGHGQNINRIIEWGTEEKKWDYVGVAHAIRAWGWMTLTDVTDDVIMREAFRTNQRVFNYDPQRDVYEEAIRTARVALEFLNRTGDGVSRENLLKGDQYLNGGDVEKWKKFVYAVMAKCYHRYASKSQLYRADSVIKYCDLAMTSNQDNINYRWSNAGLAGTYSFYGPFRGNLNTFRQTSFIANLMAGRNPRFNTGSVDPRAPYIIRENPNGTYTGITIARGGIGLARGDSSATFWGDAFNITAAPSNDNNARYIFRNNPVWPIMTASEMLFTKAEAQLIKGDRVGARNSFRLGIELNFNQLRSTYEEPVPTALRMTQAQQDAYLNNPINVPSSSNLTFSDIMLQKYIALYGWGGVETWVDMRRYHYTDLDPVTGQQVYAGFTPPSGINLWPNNFGKLIYRLRPRYNSEYLYNINELNRLGAFAPDYITKECWFSIKE
jgi:hypothetical protein